jgi:hypothetical protein
LEPFPTTPNPSESWAGPPPFTDTLKVRGDGMGIGFVQSNLITSPKLWATDLLVFSAKERKLPESRVKENK